MPLIGEIRKGTEIGYKSQCKCIWHACKDCGKERWVQYSKGIPKNTLCFSGIRDDNRAENLALTMKQYHKKRTIEVVLKEHVKVLENKIDKILEGQKELKQEIRLLRFENRTLKERSTL